MILKPTTIDVGERFGKLTVLEKLNYGKTRGPRYRCGCACGRQGLQFKARQLLRGEVTSCRKCAAPSGSDATEESAR